MVIIVILVQEPHAIKWQNAADFGAECLKIFSEDFGMYVYHNYMDARKEWNIQ